MVIRRPENDVNVLSAFYLDCLSTGINLNCFNQDHSERLLCKKFKQEKKPNTPSKSAKFKKCRRHVTHIENKTPHQQNVNPHAPIVTVPRYWMVPWLWMSLFSVKL